MNHHGASRFKAVGPRRHVAKGLFIGGFLGAMALMTAPVHAAEAEEPAVQAPRCECKDAQWSERSIQSDTPNKVDWKHFRRGGGPRG
ncbi:MAG: hypothetical protein KIT73_06665 [Burkholderiales bacterium]|nr:hypothetical protein [Burkholderiales bacterium]